MNIDTLGRQSTLFPANGESSSSTNALSPPGFADLLNQARQTSVTPDSLQKPGSMSDAARQMEVHLVTFMLKTMDQSGGEGGLLGNSSEGMGYFKDQFFSQMAQEMVERQGLGFAEALNNSYQPQMIRSQRDSQFKLTSPVTDKTYGK